MVFDLRYNDVLKEFKANVMPHYMCDYCNRRKLDMNMCSIFRNGYWTYRENYCDECIDILSQSTNWIIEVIYYDRGHTPILPSRIILRKLIFG
jgi:hypothetical protein